MEYEAVRALAGSGLGPSAISRATGIPYSTVRNWIGARVPAAFAMAGDTCGSCGAPKHLDNPPPEASYSYLLGVYLGDGHVARFPRTTCLRIYLDAKYPGIVAQATEAAGLVMPSNRVNAIPQRGKGCVVVTCYSKQWPCLLPQHGRGTKHERPILLADWQRQMTTRRPEEFVRGLIHSDGSRFTNPVRHRKSRKLYTYPRYSFSNRSDDIRRLFCEHLDLLGIAWRPVGRWQISVARREAVARLDEFVGPKR